jgi:hypothetical protein
MKKRRVNLFVVGEPRCGTTALHYFLDQHPDIFMSRVKEPMFFAKDCLEERSKYTRPTKYGTFDGYSSLFQDVKIEKIIGESSTRYLYSRVAARRIFNYNPSAKIIALFREPADFLISYHAQQLYLLNEDQADLMKAISLEKNRKNGNNLPRTVKSPSSLYYTERVRFSQHLRRFLKYFPKKQIHVIIFENFKNNNKATYQKIIEFLSLDTTFNARFSPVNTGKTIRNRKLATTVDIAKRKLPLRSIVPPLVRIKAGELLRKLYSYDKNNQHLIGNFKQEFEEVLKQEVILLNDLLQKYQLTETNLLNTWGYEYE